MNQYTQIILKEIVAEGFRGFKEEKVISLTDGQNTFVGENGEGKSSIGELVTWVLTGKSFFGKTKDINVINKDTKSAMGRLVFIDENGETHEIERKLTSTTTIKFDKKRITQKNLDEMIATELFLLIFNPLYFLSLDTVNSRQAIYSLLPNITKEEVLAKLPEKERLLLEKEMFDIQNTNKFLIAQRKELTELEDKQKYIEGYLEKTGEEEVKVPEERIFDNAKIEAVEKQLELLMERKPALLNLTDQLAKKAEIEQSLAFVKNQRFESQSIKMDLLNRKTLIEQQIKLENEKVYRGFDSSKLDVEVAVLRNNYANILGQDKAVIHEAHVLNAKQVHFHEGEQCPSCKQIITKQAVDGLNRELQEQVKVEKDKLSVKHQDFTKTLTDLEEEGKRLVAEIQGAKKKDDELRVKFEEVKKQVVAKLQADLDKVHFQLNNLVKEEEQFKSEQLSKVNVLTKQMEQLQLDVLEKQNMDIQKAFNEEIHQERQVLQNTLIGLRKEKEAVITHESNRKAIIKRVEETAKNLENERKQFAENKKQMTLLKKKITAMKNFNAQKTLLVNDTLSKYLENVSLLLEKTVQSTGEIKDCFDILYNEKDLKVCSTSENIKAGLELSAMIRKLSGFNYPIFIDNGESITSYVTQTTQVIETKVQKGQKLAIMKDGKAVEIKATPKVEKTVLLVEDEEAIA